MMRVLMNPHFQARPGNQMMLSWGRLSSLPLDSVRARQAGKPAPHGQRPDEPSWSDTKMRSWHSHSIDTNGIIPDPTYSGISCSASRNTEISPAAELLLVAFLLFDGALLRSGRV
jgi:hypothetical protein